MHTYFYHAVSYLVTRHAQLQISVGLMLFLENPELVDLIEPSEILIDPIELMELCPVERPKVDLNDSTPSDQLHFYI